MNNRSIEKIGKGGNNLVYETKKNSENGIILKFNFHSIGMLINSILGKIDDRNLFIIRKMIEKRDVNILRILNEVEDKILVDKIVNFYKDKESKNIDDIINHVKEYFLSNNHILSSYKEDIEYEIESYNNLSKFFDKKNLLNEKIFNINSSYINEYSDDIINDLMLAKGVEKLSHDEIQKLKSYILEKNINIPIIIQEKFNFKNKENVFEFNSDIPIYDNFEKILKEDLIKKDYKDSINELSRFIQNNKINELLDKDLSSKDAVCDFLRRAINYTKNTHQFIDFFGGENIFFYKEDNIYQYKLVDPVMKMRNYSNNPNFKNDSFEYFLEENKDNLRHFYVYMKTINDLSERLGIDERLKPEDYFGTKINGVEEEINNFIK